MARLDEDDRDGLLRLATHLVERLPTADGLEMALVVGSVARGLVNAASDLDLVLVWADDAVAESPAEALARLQAVLVASVETPDGRFEKYRLDDRFVDVEHLAVGAVRRVADHLATGQIEGRDLKIAVGLRDALALRGADALASWRPSMACSDELARAEVVRHGRRVLPIRSLYELSWARGDPLSFWARVSEVLLANVGLLGAANRELVPTEDPKWLGWHLGRMARLPPRTWPRIEEGLRWPMPAAMEDLDRLQDEVLDLVDALVPGADTRAPRYVLRLRRLG